MVILGLVEYITVCDVILHISLPCAWKVLSENNFYQFRHLLLLKKLITPFFVPYNKLSCIEYMYVLTFTALVKIFPPSFYNTKVVGHGELLSSENFYM